MNHTKFASWILIWVVLLPEWTEITPLDQTVWAMHSRNSCFVDRFWDIDEILKMTSHIIQLCFLINFISLLSFFLQQLFDMTHTGRKHSLINCAQPEQPAHIKSGQTSTL